MNSELKIQSDSLLTDRHVGGRIRARRIFLGISQEKLGEATGITFQQVQKYERGINRVSASKLYEFSKVLSVPVSYFFDNLNVDALQEENSEYKFDHLERKETYDLVRAYYNVKDFQIRRQVIELLKTLSEQK